MARAKGRRVGKVGPDREVIRDEVEKARRATGLKHDAFAGVLGLGDGESGRVMVVRWETGARKPSGAALMLLGLIAKGELVVVRDGVHHLAARSARRVEAAPPRRASRQGGVPETKADPETENAGLRRENARARANAAEWKRKYEAERAYSAAILERFGLVEDRG